MTDAEILALFETAKEAAKEYYDAERVERDAMAALTSARKTCEAAGDKLNQAQSALLETLRSYRDTVDA